MDTEAIMDDKSLGFILRTLVKNARGQQDMGALDECLRLLPADERDVIAARQLAERQEMEKRHALERT